MKLKASNFIPLLWAANSYAIHGHITQDTTWSDTVLVTGDVVVDSGVCLTIEPGTIVRFSAGTSEWDDTLGYDGLCDLIIAGGQLVASGTYSDSILFTSTADTIGRDTTIYDQADWGGIKFLDIVYCKIQFAKIKYTYIAIQSKNGDLNIENCVIAWAFECGAQLTSGKFKIKHNIINNIRPFMAYHGEAIGIATYNADSIEILNNIIEKCRGPGGDGSSGGTGFGIYCDSSCGFVKIDSNRISNCVGGTGGCMTIVPSSGGAGIGIFAASLNTLIENNNITQCVGGAGGWSVEGFGPGGYGIGIYCKAQEYQIAGNYVKECSGGFGDWGGQGIGIEICSEGEVAGNTISLILGGEGEEMDGNGVGIWITENVKLSQNDISDNKTGIFISNGTPVIGGMPNDQNDIYKNTNYNMVNYTSNDVIATYNWWGTTNRDTIEKYIFDRVDSSALGRVIYEPWAEEPLGIKERKKIGGQFDLQIYPNPFYQPAEIRFETTQKTPVSLKIYDAAGRLVRNFADTQNLKPKTYKIVWDGRDNTGQRLPTGVYFCTLEAQDIRLTKKLILLR